MSSPPLENGQHEIFSTPEVSSEKATLFEHCRRAVGRGLTQSSLNGLPLIGTGDWNDGMNLVGAEGKGESVWLAWFLCDVLKRMAELAELLDMEELSQSYIKDREILAQRIEQTCWDGKWYLRATFDDGSPLGSHLCKEAKIDSLPQSWAWLSGVADPDGRSRHWNPPGSIWSSRMKGSHYYFLPHLTAQSQHLVISGGTLPECARMAANIPMQPFGWQWQWRARVMATERLSCCAFSTRSSMPEMLRPSGTMVWSHMLSQQMFTALLGKSAREDGPGIPDRQPGCIAPGLKRFWVYR